MGWPGSIFIGVVTSAAATVLAGLVAILAVDWYQITGREGASGYFVAAIALLGLVAGLLIGIVVARIVAGRPSPGFLKALGMSLGIVVGLAGAAAALARSFADVPPRIDGEPLLLAVEVRWPAGQRQSPASDPGEGFLTLGSVDRLSHTQRASTRGPLWKEDARLVDGRWIAPGAVEVFTSRGLRSLDVAIDTTSLGGFIVPLPARPGKRDLEWSGWLPESIGDGRPWPDDKLSYRYRAQRISQPIRLETFGSFEIATIASNFYDAAVDGKAVLWATAEFAIRYQGKPIPTGANQPTIERADAVATIPGPVPGLLVHEFDPANPGPTYLVVGGGDQARVERLADYQASAVLLTSDTRAFHAARRRPLRRGWIDRETLAQPAVFLVGSNVVDTRRMIVRHFSAEADVTGVPAVPPLGLSPDERSFVTFGLTEHSDDHPALVVTDAVGDTAYVLPIDPARMRYATLEVLDPAWVGHHFAWQRVGGVDRLLVRTGFVPLPYHGALSGEGDGESYRLEPAGEPLRSALLEFLIRQFHAESLPSEPDAYERSVRIDGRIVKVASSSSFNYVAVSMERGASDHRLLAAIAKGFDAELATGKHDGLFGKSRS